MTVCASLVSVVNGFFCAELRVANSSSRTLSPTHHQNIPKAPDPLASTLPRCYCVLQEIQQTLLLRDFLFLRGWETKHFSLALFAQFFKI